MTPELALALIVTAATASQLLAKRIAIPAIVPLLIAGLLMGPYVLDVFDPDELFGDLLQPIVALAVGVILFEGGVALRADDLRHGAGRVVLRLVTIGVAITWGLVTAAAVLILDMNFAIAVILGAVLTLSGPTVVLPIVRFISPTTRLATILKWEGIIIDPVGAILAVLTFGAVTSGERGEFEIGGFALTCTVGALVGLAAAAALTPLLRTSFYGNATKSVAMLTLVFLAVAVASTIREDAGLVAAIVMGIAITHLYKQSLEESAKLFTESLVEIMIGTIFVVLAASVDPQEVIDLGWPAAAFVGVLVLVIRPLSVALCTARTNVTFHERVFLAGMMPRGIVAAATVSAFEASLIADGVEDAELLIPVTFLVIASTVVIYGLGARPLAKALRVTTSRNRH